MKMLSDFFKKNRICNPPYDYYFLKNLDEKEYPLYLAKLFYLNTGEKLPLKYDFKNKSWIIDKKRCKTFNQKIQWIKLYGVTDLMRKCTDKVLVRDYVAEKIGSKYLKPVLQVIPSLNCDCHVIARNNSTLGDEAIQGERSQNAVHENSEIKSNNQLDCHVAIAPRNDGQLNDVSSYFDQIDFDKLPNSSRVDFSLPKQDVTTYYNQIDWEKLPNAFVIKCNHGCKWQYIIKNKEEFLKNKRLFDIVKRNMTGWLEMDYSFWGGFEMQYKVKSADRHCGQVDFNLDPARQSTAEKYNQPDCHVTQNAVVPCNDKYIEPKILIEPLLREDINTPVREIEVYCFNGNPEILIRNFYEEKIAVYNGNLEQITDLFDFAEEKILFKADDLLKQSFDLSKQLSKSFRFVRIDWMLYKNSLYFEEMTFTAYSGFFKFKNKKNNRYLGKKFER